jgi:hypothetical protein
MARKASRSMDFRSPDHKDKRQEASRVSEEIDWKIHSSIPQICIFNFGVGETG